MAGNDQDVIDVLTPREDAYVDDPADAYLLGTAVLKPGETARGQVLIDRIFWQGESAEGHLLMGMAHFNSRDYQNAVNELARAVALNPSLPSLQTVYGPKFRTISVKVKRPGTTVYARKGYRAVRTPGASPLFSYEAPALVMLDGATLPNAFPSRVGAFLFPERNRPGLTPIVVRVMTDALRFDVDAKRATYNAQAAVVVRIRDANGQVVQKLSQQYVLSGAAAEMAAARTGEIIFYREAELPPGAYQVESLVYDAVAEKGSGRVSTLVVPGQQAPPLRMSSLVLVSRTEKTPAQTKPAGEPRTPPFYYGDLLLYPNLGEPLRRQDGLSFYFVVYPVPGRCACEMRVALLSNGRSLGETTRALQPTGDARLPHLAQLPIENLTPGTYELRVVVTDTVDQQSRSTFFTVGA